MTETASRSLPSSSTSGGPQPGDGAFLVRPPQPGDGAFLTQSQRQQQPQQHQLPPRPNDGSFRGLRQQGGRGQGRGRRGGRPAGDESRAVTANSGPQAGPSSGPTEPTTASPGFMSIGEENMPNRRNQQNGRRGGPSGGRPQQSARFQDRVGTEGEDAQRPKNPGTQRTQRQKRPVRAPLGNQPNTEESVALGRGTTEFENTPSPHASGSSTPLNASAHEFAPNGDSNSRPTPPASEAGGRRKGRKQRGKESGRATPRDDEPTSAAPPKPVSSRRAAFDKGSKLTTAADDASKRKTQDPADSAHSNEPRANEPDDLNSRLTRGLRGKPHLECPICFNPIFPKHETWSCLPPQGLPEFPIDMEENEKAKFASSHYTACYTPFHIRCVRDWANRSLHEDEQRTRAPGEDPSWRCPGCQKRRTGKIGGYRCFCARQANPPISTSAPHSCNDACGRVRPNCDHACPLNCHPGPCPPCQVALVVQCPSHGTPLTVKCAAASTNDAALTPVCDEPCPRRLNCGKHDCDKLCHFGPCAPCDEVETVRCYCGHDEKVVPCGWNSDAKKMCATETESWVGRFACDRVCGQPYECGIHRCEEKCHPHSVSLLPCPMSPSVITTCPCGATPLTKLPGYPRADCLSTIPMCRSPCPKLRPCGHQCPLKCHMGDCPPCHQQVTRPCRCGETTLSLDCDEVRERHKTGETEFLCERVCKALRNCGRHECGRQCCPLAYMAKRKGRRALDGLPEHDDLHVCHLTCGRVLSCGIHSCPRPDHKGACGRCLQASFDELICNCGNTVVYPPVACGTQVNCVFPCARPDPLCGHPKTPHNCHEDPECPPCPFLTTKPCACGKDPAVKNVRCSQSQDRVSCGQTCGKLLGCGYHKCEKTCHPGECEECTQTCNKPKRICKHACTAVCHAPAKCPESEPCPTVVTQTCACGHLQQRTSCGASTSNATSRESIQLKCNSECMVRQRNARLADALGIKQPVDRTLTEWPPEMRAFAESNAQFVKMVELTFRDFFMSTRQTLILPHMPPAKRTFVMSLADEYHLGRELIDAEPNRSVQIRRRVDTRIPSPLLSAAAPPPTAKPYLGGLGNLRSATPSVWGPSRPGTSTPPSAPSAAAAVMGGSGPTSRVASPGPATTRNTPGASPSAPVASTLPSAPAAPVPTMTTVPIPYVPPTAVDDDDWDKSGDEAE